MENKRIKLETSVDRCMTESAAAQPAHASASCATPSPVHVKTEPSATAGPSTQTSSTERPAADSDAIQLAPAQEQVLSRVKAGHNVFFTGSAGTGKSLVLRRIVQYFRTEKNMSGDDLVVTAPTGLAGTNVGGGTLHSWAGVGINVESLKQTLNNIVGAERYPAMRDGVSIFEAGNPDALGSSAKRWIQCKVLIIDEVSMMAASFFDKLEHMARFIRGNEQPFGGIQLILSGDFLQLPPIGGAKSKPRFAFQATSWPKCVEEPLLLSNVYRQNDQAFLAVLNDIRRNVISPRSLAFIKAHSKPVEYPSGVWPVDLCARKKTVQARNDKALRGLAGSARPFTSYGDSRDGPHLDSLFTVQRELSLKVGARVMLLKNLVPNVLVNGSLGEVIGFSTAAQVHSSGSATIGVPFALAGKFESAPTGYAYQRYEKEFYECLQDYTEWPIVRFRCGSSTTETVDILCVAHKFYAAHFDKGAIWRKQVPLALAYAITIHKAQGQTLERVRVDLAGIFEAGQCYVALSRAANPACLEIVNWSESAVKINNVAVEWYRSLEAEAPKCLGKRAMSEMN
ncbi:ATP-dependent DNA helicase PIF1 [Phanerochaete sordida]|uniref:ATP-dependent DNA helicase n=1 Tax=Phanerochaete sordida TaxID=48140 RepID=A0A9P3G3Y1_9APHY|nr:ATP-dependent DNA helicase PIF1 [Phanerochaete sordida]